jgi:hypothetical protein
LTPIRREALLAPIDDEATGTSGPADDATSGGLRSDGLREGGRPPGIREVMLPGDDVSLDLLERARSMLRAGVGDTVATGDLPDAEGVDDPDRPSLPRREPGVALDAELAAARAEADRDVGEMTDGRGPDRSTARGEQRRPDPAPDRNEVLVAVGGPRGHSRHQAREDHGHERHAGPAPDRDRAGQAPTGHDDERKEADGG